jgi:hypothetical protein
MYREFNVVRKSDNKDTWTGKLEEKNEDDEAPSASSSPTTVDETAKAEEEPDISSNLRRRGAEAPAGGDLSDVVTEDPADRGEAGDLGLLGGATGAGGLGKKGGSGGEDNRIHAEERKDGPFAPPPPATQPSRDQPAPEPEPLEFDDDADDEGGAGDVTTKSDSAKRSSKSSKPKARPAPKKSPAPSSGSSSRGALADDPFLGPGHGWGGGGGRSTGRRWRPRPLQLKVREFPGSSSRTLARVEGLRARVQANPDQRSLHSQLVRTAMRAGHPQTAEFARDWAEVDPDHAPALESLADTLAQTGDPLALRAYESVLEVRPFSDDAHERLALAYENKGDLRRSCSHRRAVVSIDPAKTDHQAALMACLRKAGRRTDADEVRETFLAKRTAEGAKRIDKLGEQLEREAAKSSITLHRGAQLKATLTWAGEDDLDIAIVDRRGRRLSTMRPDRFVRAVEGRGSETVTMRRVSGSVFVEVTRNRPPHGGSGGTASAVLELKTGGRTHRINVSLVDGTTRVAKVFWGR